MIKPEQIPDEVVQNAIQAMHEADDYYINDEYARVAITAAINSWPGAFQWTFNGPRLGTSYILPLPLEKTDD